MQNTMWAMRMVNNDSFRPMKEKNIRVATAVTISGTSSGRPRTPFIRVCPRKARPRMPSAARVARTVEARVARVATSSEFFAARRISGSLATTAYHFRLKLSQSVADWPLLKLSTTSTRIGM
ncbi:Uncharacterised protein [Klebsiella pneumoniae]|nr:Uncharacterised protein [Klebsiella pneumoniae]